MISAFNDSDGGKKMGQAHTSTFKPTLLSHDEYLEMYSGWEEVFPSTSVVLKDVHPVNGIEHEHTITRLIMQKPRK